MKIVVKKTGKDKYEFEHNGNLFTGGKETYGVNKTPDYSIKAAIVKCEMEKEGKHYLDNLEEMSLRIGKIELEYI